MLLVGYARVSTAEQNTELQTDALRSAGCERIFIDHASGADTERPELARCLAYLRKGDVLTVWKLDRLGRSLAHLMEMIEDLRTRGVQFKSLTNPIDTTTPAGMLIFQIFGALGEFERSLIRERVMAGIESARARGRIGGRRHLVDEESRWMIAVEASTESNYAVAKRHGISAMTVGRYVQEFADDRSVTYGQVSDDLTLRHATS